jgi:hypothetical protein
MKNKKEHSEDLEIMVYEFGKKVFETKGKPKKAWSETDLFRKVKQ